MNRTQTTLITGGTSGIGLELAHQAAQHGHNLIITGRSMERLAPIAKELEEKYSITVIPLQNNLSDSDAPQALFDAVKEKGLHVDNLINNAGFATQGDFTTIQIEKELDMIRVNVAALTHLTKLFLPTMLEKGSGRIMNVASTAGFQPGPYMAAYFATKAYVLSLTEAIAEEISGGSVTISALCPGPTATGFATRAGTEGKGFFKPGSTLNAADVAKIGFDGMMRGKRIIITGFRNKALIFLNRLSPRTLVTKIVASLVKSGH